VVKHSRTAIIAVEVQLALGLPPSMPLFRLPHPVIRTRLLSGLHCTYARG
jgi:hypothetical protein